MGRSAILSNGRLAVGLDERGFVSDFYYPHVGMHNRTSARTMHHKIGLWADGVFCWLEDEKYWHSDVVIDENSMMTRTSFVSDRLGLSLSFKDFVDSQMDIFGRVVIVENRTDQHREVRLFFAQVFQLSRNGRGDTALYVPAHHPYILTYSDNISFVSSLRDQDGTSFDQFAVGNYGIEGKEGTYKDAEDGVLSGNLVEHGGVDSVIGITLQLKPKQSHHVDYWVAASARGYNAASELHRALAKSGLLHYLNATHLHWKQWLSKSADFINSLDVKYQALAKRSLLTVRAHIDGHGGVLASADSSIYNYGRDYYSYVWPRDSYYALMPLLRLGYVEEIKKYLDFIVPLMHRRGYMHHKYLADGNIGSSWHPFVQDGQIELNIQEDETASTVLLAIDYLREIGIGSPDTTVLFDKLILPASNFMSDYIDPETSLPHASYDLWEQLFLTSSYTTSVVYGALRAACQLALDIGRTEYLEKWQAAADGIEKNYSRLFCEEKQYFVRGLESASHGFAQNETLDISSLYGMSTYGPAAIDNTSVYSTKEAVEKYLQNPHFAKGVMRYPGDDYMTPNGGKSPNSWYVCTFWLAQYYARSGDRARAVEALDWALDKVGSTQMMSEQIDPATGQNRGVTPLVWSHAEYLSLLLELYL